MLYSCDYYWSKKGILHQTKYHFISKSFSKGYIEEVFPDLAWTYIYHAATSLDDVCVHTANVIHTKCTPGLGGA